MENENLEELIVDDTLLKSFVSVEDARSFYESEFVKHVPQVLCAEIFSWLVPVVTKKDFTKLLRLYLGSLDVSQKSSTPGHAIAARMMDFVGFYLLWFYNKFLFNLFADKIEEYRVCDPNEIEFTPERVTRYRKATKGLVHLSIGF